MIQHAHLVCAVMMGNKVYPKDFGEIYKEIKMLRLIKVHLHVERD